MKRLKKFLLYALVIVGLWIFSNIIICVAINNTYKSINAKINVSSPKVVIQESKATNVNGIVSGCIKNNTNDIINNKYLKIDIYSKNDIQLGTKYIEIKQLEPNEEFNFEIWYKFNNADYAVITCIDNINNASSNEFLSQKAKLSLIIGKLMFLCFI